MNSKCNKILVAANLLIFLSAIKVVCQTINIPLNIDNWNITVLKPGNEVYNVVSTSANEFALPDYANKVVNKIISDNMKIDKVQLNDNGNYKVVCRLLEDYVSSKRYDFEFNKENKLVKISFKDYILDFREIASKTIREGSLKEISVSDIPQKTLEILKELLPHSSNIKAYSAQSEYGKRLITVFDNFAVFMNENGMIRSAAAVSDGALNSYDKTNDSSFKTDIELYKEAVSILSNYKNRFNINETIKKLTESAQDKDEFRFIVLGDPQGNADVFSSILKHIKSLEPKPEFVIIAGDLVERGFAQQYQNYFITPAMDFDIPIITLVGNHDIGTNNMAVEYRYLFGEQALNYYFDYNGYRIIAVDNVSKVVSPDETLTWLENILKSTPKSLNIIVAAHKPPSVIKKWAWHAWDKKNSEIFVDLMTKYKVDHVFTGHIHAYSTATINGVDYSVSGGGGGELDGKYGLKGDKHHYLICVAKPNGKIEQKLIVFNKK